MLTVTPVSPRMHNKNEVGTVTIAYKGKSLKWEGFRRLQDSHLTDSYCSSFASTQDGSILSIRLARKKLALPLYAF